MTVFFFNATPTTEIYTFPYTTLFRSLPGRRGGHRGGRDRRVPVGLARLEGPRPGGAAAHRRARVRRGGDRKSTRLNSSHTVISYAVFCLKKKNIMKQTSRVIIQ